MRTSIVCTGLNWLQGPEVAHGTLPGHQGVAVGGGGEGGTVTPTGAGQHLISILLKAKYCFHFRMCLTKHFACLLSSLLILLVVSCPAVSSTLPAPRSIPTCLISPALPFCSILPGCPEDPAPSPSSSSRHLSPCRTDPAGDRLLPVP